MGNIILSQSFVDVADAEITARSQATGYAKINVMDRWNLKRRFRAADVTANDYLMKFDFGAAQTLVGILLYDVNFNKVKIQGHTADSWGTPDYAGTDLTVSANKVTGRYQIYIPLTAFNYQWSRVYIPSGTSAVGDYTSAWEVGTICFLSSVTELSHNMAYGYGQTGRKFYKDSVNERIALSEEIRWEGKLAFGNRSLSNEDELWAFNRYDMSLPFVYYENRGDTSEAYLVVRDTSFESTEFDFNAITGNTIGLREAYMLDQR